MIEKQETYQQDHDCKAKEKNKSLVSDSSVEKKKQETDVDVAMMIHVEETGSDRQDIKSPCDEFPSTKPSREAEVCAEPSSANKGRFVIQLSEKADLFQDQFQGTSQASDPEAQHDVALGSHQIKECTASKPRKKRRPQSLNLGMPAELIYSKGGGDSTEEEDEGSDSDNSPETPSEAGNHCESSSEVMKGEGEDQPIRVCKDSKQENISTGESQVVSTQEKEHVKEIVSQAGSAEIHLGSVNGPGKVEHDSSVAGVKGECVMKVRGKGLIDNKELAEVKLRQVRTHERKISSSGGDDMEGLLADRGQRSSLHRLSGHSEITRIVPLKPERSKSIACKDERTGQDEPTRGLRREYRWSVGSPEGSTDLNWTDVSSFHSAFAADMESIANQEHPDDLYQSCRASTETQSSKISALPKMAPPAPPVKTQKARESGLILRNSRIAGREPSLEAAKKRHSVTVLGICYSVIGYKASHELQKDLHAIFLLFYLFRDLKQSSIRTICGEHSERYLLRLSGPKKKHQSMHLSQKDWTFSYIATPPIMHHTGKSVQIITDCER